MRHLSSLHRYSAFPLLASIALATMVLVSGCDSSSLTSHETKPPPSQEDPSPSPSDDMLKRAQKNLESDFVEVKSARKENTRVYELEDGQRVLHLRIDTDKNATGTTSDVTTKASDSSQGPVYCTVRYKWSGSTGYTSDVFYNVGNFSGFDDGYTDERVRCSYRFTGTTYIPSGSSVSNADLDIDVYEPFGELDQSQRGGFVELTEYSDGSVPDTGTKSHYDAVAAGGVYSAQEISDTETMLGYFASGGAFTQDIEDAVDSGSAFALGVKAETETSSGALFSLGAYADIFIFYTPPANAPSTPSLVSPSSGATLTGTSVTLDWNSSDGSPTPSYEVQLDTNSSFSSPNTKTPSGTQQSYSGLSDQTTYYWRVRATNSEGTSGWSSTRSFTVDLPLTALISGPNYLEEYETGNWSASASNGEGGYSYDWHVRRQGGSWFGVCGGSSSCSWSPGTISSSQDYEIRVTVTSAGETDRARTSFLVNNNNGDPGCDSAVSTQRICL